MEDHEVHDGKGVQVGFGLVEEPLRGIKSPWSKGVCQLRDVGWLG